MGTPLKFDDDVDNMIMFAHEAAVVYSYLHAIFVLTRFTMS